VLLRSAAAELNAMGQAPPSLWARLGQLAEAEGEADAAMVAYRRAVRGDRQPPAWVADRLAWLLLTRRAGDPDAVAQARQLADYVSRVLGPEKPEGFLTLSAVHAAAGEWDAAAMAAQQGLAAAQAAGDQPRAQELERRLALYRQQASLPGARATGLP
jgi:predicted TPR repeat methyltransferase